MKGRSVEGEKGGTRSLCGQSPQQNKYAFDDIHFVWDLEWES